MLRLKVPSAWPSDDSLAARLPSKQLKITVLAFAAYSAVLAAQGFLHEHGIPNLAHANKATRESLLRHWKQGDLVVLVRHVERCDRADAPCLDSTSGITRRSAPVAVDLGKDFMALGLESTDLYTSPLSRAAQTAQFMFPMEVPQQNWLADCRGAFTDEIARHKKAHRNLLLVTHSECMSQLADSLALLSYRTPEYGESMFLTFDGLKGQLKAMGYLGADNWTALSHASDPARRP